MKQNAYHHVLNQLRQDIIQGGLKPDQKLTEDILSKKYQVSRTPLREAIRKLQTEGLVTVFPNRGARVSSFNITDLNDFFEVRELLENYAVRNAGRYITEEEIDCLQKTVETLHSNHTQSNALDNYELMIEFHARLIAFCRNNQLREALNLLIEKFAPFRYVLVTSPNATTYYTHLQNIVNYLKKRDIDALCTELTSSNKTYKEISLKSIFETNPTFLKQEVTE